MKKPKYDDPAENKAHDNDRCWSKVNKIKQSDRGDTMRAQLFPPWEEHENSILKTHIDEQCFNQRKIHEQAKTYFNLLTRTNTNNDSKRNAHRI